MTPSLAAHAASEPFIERRFDEPIDYFSVRLRGENIEYSYEDATGWSPWHTYEDDGDAVGEAPESELMMVPYGVVGLRVRGIEKSEDIHPIVVSRDPIRYGVTAVGSFSGKPFILERNQWGADESYLFDAPKPQETPAADKGDNGSVAPSQPSGRLSDCEQAQLDHPTEFRVASTVTKDARGRVYRWPLQYSPEVKLLTVHHSALLVEGDPRPAVERVRALYKYHAQNRGWGDIGYHYVVDEEGQVYEGRQGGKSVVGGHAYCNNIGTVGVVMLGNFEIEQPTQKQLRAVQHLLVNLADDYDIDLSRSVQFHGKTFTSPIVRHRDLLSTLCPGYYVSDVFGQVVKNVRDGRPDAVVQFNIISKPKPAETERPPIAPGVAPGISFTGRTTLSINPGGSQRLSFSYTAGVAGAYEGKKVADIRLSHKDIKLYVDNGRGWIPVTTGILLPSDLPAGESTSLQMIVEAPMQAGNYTLDIGGIRITLSVAGRRIRTGNFINPFDGGLQTIIVRASTKKVTPVRGRIRPHTRRSMQSSVTPPPVSAAPLARTVTPKTSSASPDIRIRLSASAAPAVTFVQNGTLGGTAVTAGTRAELVARGGECSAIVRGEILRSSSILRLQSDGQGVLTVAGIRDKTRSYRGTLECRVIDGALALINELSMEEYMAGLAEEPDTEPYEKQRAFAIAARTYATFYLDPGQRKFPGKPYDGSDDPAVFQSYAGVDFEANNPRWVRAVQSTESQVLTSGGVVIKPPYFSSNDGRTRSPAEAGWKNFPFASIFASKPDPWCEGLTLRGHGVGMSGCGALGQANEGRSAEQILQYYYPGTRISQQ